MSESLQVWVRNDKGQVYGPLSPPSVELLIDNGIITGRMQVSTNGLDYVYPGRIPGLRMIFPKELWGDTVVPGDELDAQWGQVAMPAALPSVGGAAGGAPPGGPVGVPGGPVTAGPGTRGPVAAGPGARAPMSGPSGVMRAPIAGPAAARPGAPVQRPPARPPPVVGAPGAPAPQGPPQVASIEDAFRQATGQPASAPPPRPAAAPAPAAAKPQVSSGSGLRAAPPPRAAVPGDLSVPPSGQLEDLSPAELYFRAAASEANGLLTVVLADRELVVHFRKGNPEFLDSTHPLDSLDVFLIEQRLATAEQIAQAESQKARFGGELLPALFGLGLLNPNAVFQQLGQRAGQILYRVLTAEHGQFAFDLEELPPAKAMPLGNKWSLYLEQLRKVSAPDIKRRLHGALDLPVMRAGGPVPVTDLRLTPQETRALTHFDGVRSLSQLIGDLPNEADVLMRTAFLLHPLQLVSFAGVVVKVKPAAAAPPPPAARAPQPAAAPAPAPAARPAPVMAPPVMVAPAPVVAAPPPAAVPGNPASVPGRGSVPYPGQRPPPPVMTPVQPVGPSPAEQAEAAARAAQAAARPVISPPTLNPPVMSSPSQVASTPSGVRAAPPVVPGSGARPPSASFPAAPARPPSSASSPAVSVDAEIAQLQSLLAQMKDLNHFEVLGLKKEADTNAVKIAYLKAARSYHPDTVPPGAPEALAKVKADLFARIGEANRTLSDPKLREEYVAELAAGGKGEKVDIEKILRAEDLFNRGKMLVKNRKYADALKAFDEAIGCNNEEGEFYAWRGYMKFLVAADPKSAAPDALKDINLCVAKNANVANAYYFLGFIAKTNGDLKTARTNFKKCTDLDPKHIDAQRELRVMK
jgi:TolA-binding protein